MKTKMCSRCNRIIWLDTANLYGGTCGPDCPQGSVPEAPAKVERLRPVTDPAPVVVPPETTLPVEPPQIDGEGAVLDDEGAGDVQDAPVPEDVPQARMAARGQDRMQRGGGGR
jgi:hypothetical protein